MLKKCLSENKISIYVTTIETNIDNLKFFCQLSFIGFLFNHFLSYNFFLFDAIILFHPAFINENSVVKIKVHDWISVATTARHIQCGFVDCSRRIGGIFYSFIHVLITKGAIICWYFQMPVKSEFCMNAPRTLPYSWSHFSKGATLFSL